MLAIAAVFCAYGYLGFTAWSGRPASGASTALGFDGCPQAGRVILNRLTQMGFTDAIVVADAGGFVVTVTLPEDARIAADIPLTLATPGHVSVAQGNGLPLVPAVAAASVRMDIRAIPVTVFELSADDARKIASWQGANTSGEIAIYLDGAEIGRQSNLAQTGTEIEVEPTGPDEQSRMEAAAARAVVANHPLPCPVSLR